MTTFGRLARNGSLTLQISSKGENVTKVGFTGTRKGLTPEQRVSLRRILELDIFGELHQGDCVGADESAHFIAIEFGLRVVIHPPEDNKCRAYCQPFEDGELRPKFPYHERNHNIVDETQALIATPEGLVETRNGGTWATVRYARKNRKPVCIIYPDGTINKDKLWERLIG